MLGVHCVRSVRAIYDACLLPLSDGTSLEAHSEEILISSPSLPCSDEPMSSFETDSSKASPASPVPPSGVCPIVLVGAVGTTLEVFDLKWSSRNRTQAINPPNEPNVAWSAGDESTELKLSGGLHSRGHILDLGSEVLCMAALQHQCLVIYTRDMELVVARYQANLPIPAACEPSISTSDNTNIFPLHTRMPIFPSRQLHWCLLHRTKQLLPPIRMHTFLFPPTVSEHAFVHPYASNVSRSTSSTRARDPSTLAVSEGLCVCCEPLPAPVMVAEPDGRAVHAVFYPGRCHTISFCNNRSHHPPTCTNCSPPGVLDLAEAKDRRSCDCPLPSGEREQEILDRETRLNDTHYRQKWFWRIEAQQSTVPESGGSWKPEGSNRWSCPPSPSAFSTRLDRYWCDGLPYSITRGGGVDVDNEEIHALFLHQMHFLKAAHRKGEGPYCVTNNDSRTGVTSARSIPAVLQSHYLQNELEGEVLECWRKGGVIDAPDQFLLSQVSMGELEKEKQQLSKRLEKKHKQQIEERISMLNEANAAPDPILVKLLELPLQQFQEPPVIGCYPPFTSPELSVPRAADTGWRSSETSTFGDHDRPSNHTTTDSSDLLLKGNRGMLSNPPAQLTITSTYVGEAERVEASEMIRPVSAPYFLVALSLPAEIAAAMQYISQQETDRCLPEYPAIPEDEGRVFTDGFQYHLQTFGHPSFTIKPRKLAIVMNSSNPDITAINRFRVYDEVPVAALLLIPGTMDTSTKMSNGHLTATDIDKKSFSSYMWMPQITLFILLKTGRIAVVENPFDWPTKAPITTAPSEGWTTISFAGVPKGFSPSKFIAMDDVHPFRRQELLYVSSSSLFSPYNSTVTHRFALLLDGLGEGYIVDLNGRCAVCTLGSVDLCQGVNSRTALSFIRDRNHSREKVDAEGSKKVSEDLEVIREEISTPSADSRSDGTLGPLMHISKAENGKVWASYAKGVVRLLSSSLPILHRATSFIFRRMLLKTDEKCAAPLPVSNVAGTALHIDAIFPLFVQQENFSTFVRDGCSCKTPQPINAASPKSCGGSSLRYTHDHCLYVALNYTVSCSGEKRTAVYVLCDVLIEEVRTRLTSWGTVPAKKPAEACWRDIRAKQNLNQVEDFPAETSFEDQHTTAEHMMGGTTQCFAFQSRMSQELQDPNGSYSPPVQRDGDIPHSDDTRSSLLRTNVAASSAEVKNNTIHPNLNLHGRITEEVEVISSRRAFHMTSISEQSGQEGHPLSALIQFDYEPSEPSLAMYAFSLSSETGAPSEMIVAQCTATQLLLLQGRLRQLDTSEPNRVTHQFGDLLPLQEDPVREAAMFSYASSYSEPKTFLLTVLSTCKNVFLLRTSVSFTNASTECVWMMPEGVPSLIPRSDSAPDFDTFDSAENKENNTIFSVSAQLTAAEDALDEPMQRPSGVGERSHLCLLVTRWGGAVDSFIVSIQPCDTNTAAADISKRGVTLVASESYRLMPHRSFSPKRVVRVVPVRDSSHMTWWGVYHADNTLSWMSGALRYTSNSHQSCYCTWEFTLARRPCSQNALEGRWAGIRAHHTAVLPTWRRATKGGEEFSEPKTRNFDGILIPSHSDEELQLFQLGEAAQQLPKSRSLVCECIVTAHCGMREDAHDHGMTRTSLQCAELVTLPLSGVRSSTACDSCQWVLFSRGGIVCAAAIPVQLQEHLLQEKQPNAGTSVDRPLLPPSLVEISAVTVREVNIPALLEQAKHPTGIEEGVPLAENNSPSRFSRLKLPQSSILLCAEYFSLENVLLTAWDRDGDPTSEPSESAEDARCGLLITLDADSLMPLEVMELPSELVAVTRTLPELPVSVEEGQDVSGLVLIGTAPLCPTHLSELSCAQVRLIRLHPLRIVYSVTDVPGSGTFHTLRDQEFSGCCGQYGVTDISIGVWPCAGLALHFNQDCPPSVFLVAVICGTTLSVFRLLDDCLELLASVSTAERLTAVAVSYPFVCASMGDSNTLYELYTGEDEEHLNEKTSGENLLAATFGRSSSPPRVPLRVYHLRVHRQALEPARLGGEIVSQVSLLTQTPHPAHQGPNLFHRFAQVDSLGNLMVRLARPPSNASDATPYSTWRGETSADGQIAVASVEGCLALSLLNACHLPSQPTKVVVLHSFEESTPIDEMAVGVTLPCSHSAFLSLQYPCTSRRKSAWWWSPVEFRRPRRLQWCERDVWLPAASPSTDPSFFSESHRQCLFIPCRDGSLYTAIPLPYALGPLLSRLEAAATERYNTDFVLDRSGGTPTISTHLVPYSTRVGVRKLYPSSPPHYDSLSPYGVVFLDVIAEIFRLWHYVGSGLGELLAENWAKHDSASEGEIRRRYILRPSYGERCVITVRRQYSVAVSDSTSRTGPNRPLGLCHFEGTMLELRRRAARILRKASVQLMDETLAELSLAEVQEAVYLL